MHLIYQIMSFSQGSKVTLLSSYTDKSGLFTAELENDDKDNGGDVPAPNEPSHSTGEKQMMGLGRSEAEEEDELLYGDIDELTSRKK